MATLSINHQHSMVHEHVQSSAQAPAESAAGPGRSASEQEAARQNSTEIDASSDSLTSHIPSAASSPSAGPDPAARAAFSELRPPNSDLLPPSARQDSTEIDTSAAFPGTSAPPPPSAGKATANQLQFRVAVALAAGKSVTAAAEESGLHRSSIYKWIDQSPTFKHLFETARRDYGETLRDSLRDLSALALRTVEDLMADPKTPPSVRLRAALAVLTRPQFPNPGWNLPEQIEPDYQRELQDKLAAVQAGYDMMRMSRSLAASAPLAGSVHHKSTESDAFAGISGTQPARNALCPCGSGKKYKRCCGQSAPPVLSGLSAA